MGTKYPCLVHGLKFINSINIYETELLFILKLHPSWFHRLHFSLPEYLLQVNYCNLCVCVCVCMYFFLVVFQVPPKTRPWESPSWKTPLGLVYCCLVFILGYSFTNNKLQERRCDKTGLPPPWHESLAGFRVDGGQWGKHTGIFPWNWGRIKRACCVYHHLFPDTSPSVSENITVNNLWRWASQVAQW